MVTTNKTVTMHTTKASKTTFFHHGDFSGDIRILCDKTGVEIEIPFNDVKRLVAEYISRQRIRDIEEMTDDQILLNVQYAMLK